MNEEIIQIIKYFSGIGRPITLLELFYFLSSPVKISQVVYCLKELEDKGEIEQKNGWFYISENKEVLNNKKERYLLAKIKYDRAKKIVNILKYFPYIYGIAVYSSLSLDNANNQSDIDLFIIAKSGRMWTARFFVNFFLKIFRLRPVIGKEKDKICVSFWVDDRNLNLARFLKGDDDKKYIYGTASFVFLYGFENIVADFNIANIWLKQKMPNWRPKNTANIRKLMQKGKIIKNIFEFLAESFPENWYKNIQLIILPDRYKRKFSLGRGVFITSGVCKLHDNES